MSNYEPVKVSIGVENPSLERGAFYNICFITENDTAPRTLQVNRLSDLLNNGYSRLDLAYNFCVGVFSQQGMDTVYIRAKRSFESYVEAYNSDDNSMYYFVVLQTKDLTEVEKFNSYLVSSDEMKLQFFSQNVGSKILKSPKLVNYYQDYTLSGGASVDDNDYYLNKAYSGVTVVNKLPLPDYLLGGYGNTAADYGVRMMVGKDYIWEIDKPNRQIKYARNVVESGWVGSREGSTINNSEVTVVATKGKNGKLLRASIKDPKVKIETISSQLLKGLGKEVLDYAIPLIDPEAKDWVLDPDNNAVKYEDDSSTGISPADEYIWEAGGAASNGHIYTTYQDAGVPTCAHYGSSVTGYRNVFDLTAVVDCSNGQSWTVLAKGNPSYDPNYKPDADKEYKYIPLNTVSQQVIDNADAGHLESKEFLKSIPLFAYLLTGSGTEAVNKAVLDIDAEATDWVLDPANNAITYTIPAVPKEGEIPAPAGKGWVITGVNDGLYFANNIAAAKYSCENYNGIYSELDRLEEAIVYCKNSAGVSRYSGSVNVKNKPDNEPLIGAPSQNRGFIPIDTVAQQVISNAEAGHTPSQEALRLSTVERVNIGEYDEALEAASIEIDTSWKYLPIYDVAVQVKWNSIAGHAESIEAVNNSLPFELPDNDTPWAYVPEETIITGSTTTIKAKRTFKNQKLKSSINVTASASKVGKHLIKDGGQAALAYAVVELIGAGVDWVLDPANNAVKYTVAGTSDPNAISPANQYIWQAGGAASNGHIYTTYKAAAVPTCAYYGSSVTGYRNVFALTAVVDCSNGQSWTVQAKGNPAYDPNYKPNAPVTKSIPIDTVAVKVIANAAAGHAPSQEAVKATALEGFAAGEHDAALDDAAVIDN